MSRKNHVKMSNFDSSSRKTRWVKTINQYKIISRDLGLGAQSRVVLAEDKDRNKYAIKVIKKKKVSTGEDNEAQIMKELDILSNMSHKNIIRIHEFI